MSQFAQSKIDCFRQSDTIYVRGLPWVIYAENQENDHDKEVKSKQRVLGYFLSCDTNDAGKLTIYA
jgi:hypothetical protein